MSLGSEESITCLNQTLTLQNINEPCQYWVKSTPLPTGWIQISSTFTLLKHWVEYNQWGKPQSLKNYFSLSGAAVLYFLTSYLLTYCLLFPSVSARCQQLTNFRRSHIWADLSEVHDDLTAFTESLVTIGDKISETLAPHRSSQKINTQIVWFLLSWTENMIDFALIFVWGGVIQIQIISFSSFMTDKYCVG